MTIKTKLFPLGFLCAPYKKNLILFESCTPGTYQLEIKNGIFEIWISGGGGGGSNGAGGAGATLYVLIKLEAGIYTITVGSKGNGASAYVRNNNGSPGLASTITGPQMQIIANGGAGRNGRRNGGGGGTVGSLIYNFINSFEIILQSIVGTNRSLSYITNTNDGPGAGGIAQGNDEGSGFAGKDGYVKIQFIK